MDFYKIKENLVPYLKLKKELYNSTVESMYTAFFEVKFLECLAL